MQKYQNVKRKLHPNFLNSSRNRGKKMSEETKKKISLANKNNPPETRIKKSLSQRGKNHWNWQGGISLIREQIRKSFKYRQWRSDIFTRDDFICRSCEVRGSYLEVDHHPKLFSQILKEYKIKSLDDALNCEELWNINNGRTLCQRCHNKTKLGRNKNA